MKAQAEKKWEHLLYLPERIAISFLINDDREIQKFVASLVREQLPWLSCLNDGILVRLFAWRYCGNDEYEDTWNLIRGAVKHHRVGDLVELRRGIGLPAFRL